MAETNASTIPRFIVVSATHDGTETSDEVLDETALQQTVASYRKNHNVDTIAVYALQSAEQRITSFKALI